MQATVSEAMGRINDAIITPIITGLFALAVAYFLYGLFRFIQNQDNEEAQSEGKRHMFWAIAGIAIMFAVQGILGLIEGSVESIL